MADVIAESRQQKNLRLGLILVIGLIAITILSFISLTAEEDIKVQVSSETSKFQESTTNALDGLTYRGVTTNGNDFIILAETAREVSDLPNVVDLNTPRARLDTKNGNPMTLRSNQGRLSRSDERVDLVGRVVIVRPDIGYTLRTEAAVMHLDTGIITSNQLVKGDSPRAQIKADGIVIANNGRNVLFTGKSRLTIRPN